MRLEKEKSLSVKEELRRLNALYSPDESAVSEEETELRCSSSALTDSFRERPSFESCELLGNFLRVLEGWAGGEEEDEQGSREEEEEKGGDAGGETEPEEEEILDDEEEKKEEKEVKEKKEVKEVQREIQKHEEDSQNLDEDHEKSELRSSKRLFAYRLVESDAPKLVEELEHYAQNGKLQVKDLPVIFRSFGCNPSQRELNFTSQSILKEYGPEIDKVSFLKYLLEQQKRTFTTKDILGVFASLDVKNVGKLRNRLVHRLLSTRGEKFSVEELAVFFKEADPGKTGFINYHELVQRMDRNIYIAIPEKRRQLIKLLRKEDKRAARGSRGESDFQIN